MSILARLRGSQIHPRTAMYSIIAMVVVLAGVVFVLSRSTVAPPAEEVVSVPSARAEGVEIRVDETKGKPSPPEDRSKSGDPYAVIAQRNLFQPVNVGSSAATGSSQARGGSGAPRPTSPPAAALPPMPVVQTGNIDEVKKSVAFTGSVRVAGVEQALIENLQTKEWRYVSQGESAFGYRVIAVSPQLIVLERNGLQFTLAMGENKPDAPAAPAGAKPAGEQKPNGGAAQPQPPNR